MTLKSQHISVSINRSPKEVYAFASKPENLRHWASGLPELSTNTKGEWTFKSPEGDFTIEFVRQNEYGVLDHYVTSPAARFYNPMRVFANHEGSEVVFTLYQLPDMSDQVFAKDAKTVTRDLETLKTLLETSSTPVEAGT